MVVATAADPGKSRPSKGPEPVTVTVTERFALPPGPVQVSAYVVVAVSAPVLAVPLIARAPLQPFAAVHAVAPVVDQVRVEELPLVTLPGFALRLTVGTGGVTVTVVVWFADPPAPAPVQVRV
jgi:hypothetical protein